MRKMNYVLVVLFGLILMQSCTKDPVIDEQQGVAPKLPSQESFIMPFSGFEEADTTDLKGGSGARNFVTYTNWFTAATNIVVWNAVIVLNMAVPVASFAEAFRHDGEYQGNGIWLWAYSYTVHGKSYEAELTGQFLNEGEVQWDMFISEVGGFSKVHFYTGVVTTDGTKGEWTLNFQPNNPTPYLNISYNRDDANGTASIRYTNIIPSSPDQGDYIEYRENTDASLQFDRAYDVYRVAQDNLLEIEWHEQNKEGRVKNPEHFNDSEWRCWDTNFIDIDC